MNLRDLFTHPDRWLQHVAEKDGAICLFRGTQICHKGNAGHKVRETIREVIASRTITEWNDAPERTFEDIRRVVTDERVIAAEGAVVA